MGTQHLGSLGTRPIARGLAASMLAAGLLLTTGLVVAQETPVEIESGDGSLFTSRVLTTQLSNPWEITWGPDDMIWVTERSTGEVTRIDPYTGAQQTLLTLENFIFDDQHQGLLGMALHPELLQGTGHDYVYLAHTYEAGTAAETDPRAKLVRYTYDEESQQLVEPLVLIEGLPAWNDHNAGRVKIGPEMKIFYTIGEQGANFGGNYQRPNRAQQLPTEEQVANENWVAYSGKVLRLNLDGSIPEDNPVIEGVKSHIFTYGHRNPQGIDFGPDGTIYVSEHGPDTDDELNILQSGGNFGWPRVAGYRDDKAYIYGNWSEAPEDLRYTGRNIPDAVPQYPESEFEEEIVEPVATYWTVGDDYDFEGNCGWICNPTIAPGSIEYYDAGENGIPEWDNSVLLPTLKHGTLYVQQLAEDGQDVDGLPTAWFRTQNRYRDTTLSPDHRTVFIATDAFGTASQVYGDSGFTNVLHNPGAILMFTYDGEDGPAETAGGLTPGGGEVGTEPDAAGADGTGTSAGGTEPSTTDDAASAADDEAASDDEAATEGGGDTASLDFDTLYEQGQARFRTTCAACHGLDGQGAQGPAFVGNEDLGDTEYVATTILHGFGYMPPFGQRLSDEQIASVATYIRNSWGNEFGAMQPGQVAAQR